MRNNDTVVYTIIEMLYNLFEHYYNLHHNNLVSCKATDAIISREHYSVFRDCKHMGHVMSL
jgi:hypothetical protein